MQTLRRDFCVGAALTLLLLAGLNGCGRTDEVAGGTQPRRTPTRKAPDSAELALANMVNAVSAGKPTGDVELKFDLRERPIVGQPADVDFVLIPRADLDRVYATFQAGEGLEITKGGKTPEIDHPQTGTPIRHTITIVPQHDGVFYVSAVVLADSATQSATRSFSIPVIVGAGISTPTAAQPAQSRSGSPSAQGH